MSFEMKLTADGAAKVAAYLSLGTPTTLATMRVGDGGGTAVPHPTGGETALVHQVASVSVASLAISPSDPSIVVIEANFPDEIGGWAVREVGVFDSTGTLFAYGNFPETYKPVAAEGSSRYLVIAASIRVASAAAVTIAYDPTLVLATRAWVSANFPPVGTIDLMPNAASGAPGQTWLKCDGASYLQASYSTLFAKIGTLPRLTWTHRTDHAVGGGGTSIWAVNTSFVIMSSTSSATASQYTSDNGATWSTLTLSSASVWQAICWTGTKYVAISNTAGVCNSATLGATFTARTSAFSSGGSYGIASDGAGNVISIGTSSGVIAAQKSTNNGDTWALCTLPSAGAWTAGSIIYAAGRWVFTATASGLTYIYTSTDGTTWTLAASGLAATLTAMAYFSGKFYAVGSHNDGYSRVAKSTNGTSWTLPGPTAYPMGFTGGYFSGFRGASTSNGLLMFASTAGVPAIFVYDDFRALMELAPPPAGATVANSLVAYGGTTGNLVMQAQPSANFVWTAPLFDYVTASEFIVPDIKAPIGANSNAYHIRAA